MPQQGSQTGDKIYGSLDVWYAEGNFGSDTFPTIWFSEMDGSNPRGLFHVGPDEAPFHGRKIGDYLFTVPQWYANRYLGGRTLITGKSRGTPADDAANQPVTIVGGSVGPTLFAFQPLQSENPESGSDLDSLPILYYRVMFPGCGGPNVGDKSVCDYLINI